MSSLTPTERYLQDFHQRWAGATSAMFAQLGVSMAGSHHASSYAALAAQVPSNTPGDEPIAVLDLACGDGHLLKLLADRAQPSLRLTGVDMSQGELDAARAVLPDSVTLLRERAQALSIVDGTMDVVLSHMALMLMGEIEQVIAEIRRVLRPGGVFAAIVGRNFLLGEAATVFHRVFRPIAEEDLSPLPFGDARTRSEDGWRTMLEGRFDALQFDDIDVGWTPMPAELWDALLQTYSIDRMSDSARARLREQLIEGLAPLQQENGTIQTGWGMRLVRGRAV